MPKAIIEQTPNKTWRLIYYRPHPTSSGLMAVTEFYMFWQGAVARLESIAKKLERETRSLERLMSISLTYLSCREHNFVQHMNRTKCRGITVRQYGYLKGIWERNIL